mgnify:CR=1 FL=1
MSSQESKSRSGRFDLPANELVEKFNATIPFEQRVCPFDIKDSQTHAAMLARQGIISEADAQAIAEFSGEIDMSPIEDELAVFEEAFLEQNER